MHYEAGKLHSLLRSARRRRRLMIALRGAAVCLGVLACVLLLLGWAAYRYRGSEGALLALRVGALVAFVAAVYLSLVRPLARRISEARLARFIEERARGTEERLVTAIEFEEGDEARRVSRALLERLRSDADGAAAGVDLDRVYSRRALAAYGAAALLSLLLFAGVLKWGPRGLSEGVAQLVAPSGMAAEADPRAIKVKPGTARVPKGSDQDITAALAGFEAEAASLFTRAAGAGDDAWQGQAMEQAKARGEFELSLVNVQEPVEYFVESEGVRSEVFKLEVVDLPFVKQLDLVLNFPAFSRLPAKAVEDGGDVAALKGTVVTVTARLSGKARAARIVFADGRKVEMKAAGQDFVGALTVAGDTSYFVELTSVDGEVYRGSNEYDVTALEDLPPTVSFERPGRDTKATNLEEVFTQARAEDDFGVASIELFFSVNGGDEQKVNLQELSRDAARSLTGTHTFFMEEYKLKPGDFISYYAKARDASNETTSDIYFIEVKPFEMQYRQSQQQGGGGQQGEGGDQDQNALTRRQKELIAATHRLMREGQRYTPQERADGYEAVAAGQEKLKADTLEFVERLRRRMGEQLDGREELSRMAEDLRAAAREMEGAPPPLRKQAGRDALPPEQRALQRLLAADAIFREMQVAFGQQGGGGGGGERESRELTDLMELELDKMKNQYETLNREQRQRTEQAKSEAERRLEELARRQERALEEQRRRQQGQPQNGGGGGGGSQRQQQEMAEEARRAARELERLSRERRDARMQELSRQLDQAADDLQRAQSSSRNNPNDSIAQGERALERMRQAQRRLQQMRGGGSAGQQGQRQEIGELRRRAAEAAARQRELTREAEQLARRGGQQGQQGQQGEESARAARERLNERAEALAESVNNLEEDARQTARALGEGKQQAAARRLNEAADALRRNRVAERTREGARGAEQGRPESAREAGRAAERGLGEMSERLQEAEAAAGRPSGNGAEEALDRTRQLADDLDSLRRRLEERAARREGRGQQQSQGSRQQGGQKGQQGEQSAQQGQSGQEGQQGGQQPGGRQQGSRSQQQGQQSAQQSGGGGSSRGGDMIGGTGEDDARQLGSELRERLRDAERLRQELGGSSGNRELGGIIGQLRGMTDGRMDGEAQTAAALKAQVIDPLRQLELELSKRLREQLGRTNLRLGDEGAAPGRYRKSVEEYYRRLSQGGRR
ncbi:MAG TPA: hypothetical protein VN282_21420 [Pyrinomonadaceae bacterium]|nr:hypothetical protein [Pyrinomonadaceae bacterium]